MSYKLILFVLCCIYVKAQTQISQTLVNTIFGVPPQQPCKCVPNYLCLNGTMNTNGYRVVNPRQGGLAGGCTNYLETCCALPHISPLPIPTPPTVRRSGCGQHYPNGKVFQMIGNQKNESNYSEFPWMVIILQENILSGTSQKILSAKCGGALINTKVVITAAHCLTEKKTYIVRAGEWDTRNTKEIYPTQDQEVESIITHPNFFEPALLNDIALIFLKTSMNIAENVDVVCLPKKGAIFDNANCFATGWGRTSFSQHSKFANILKKISLPVVPSSKCQDALRNTRLGQFFELDQSFICAGGNPKEDTCDGDGGGPLVCPVSGKSDTYQLAGLVSWGLDCGDPIPAAYVNVAVFREWIDKTMIAQGLDTSSYQFN